MFEKDESFSIVVKDQVTGVHAGCTDEESYAELSAFDDSPMDHSFRVSNKSGMTWNQDNNVLWRGNPMHMTEKQVIELSQPVSLQLTGIVLVWSRYANGSAKNDSWYYQFVPKWHAMNHGTEGVYTSIPLGNSSSDVCNKYLYVDDVYIRGHVDNTSIGAGYRNNSRVLRAILGV